MELNYIRSAILLVAGLILIIFPAQVMAFQKKITTRLRLRYEDSRRTLLVFGVFLIIAAVGLFVWTLVR